MDNYKIVTNFKLPDDRTVAYETEGASMQDALETAMQQFMEQYRCSRTEAVLYVQGGEILHAPKASVE